MPPEADQRHSHQSGSHIGMPDRHPWQLVACSMLTYCNVDVRVLSNPFEYDEPQVFTLEGENQEDVVAAAEALEKSLPAEYLIKVVADDDLKDI